jgi:hypothetical protein
MGKLDHYIARLMIISGTLLILGLFFNDAKADTLKCNNGMLVEDGTVITMRNGDVYIFQSKTVIVQFKYEMCTVTSLIGEIGDTK